MSSPLVSIIVPCYRHEQFLPACLDSVLAQTFTDWELILVDDQSPDGSFALAQSYAARDSRIQAHLNEKNLGTYGNQQKALEMAKGRYVAVLNSDDFWAPEKLLAQVNVLEQNLQASACFVLGWKADEKGIIDEAEDVNFDWPTAPEAEFLPYLLYENRILASGVLFRREGLRFETHCRYSGDWIALLEARLRGPLLCLSGRLTYWRQHDTNSYLRSPKQLSEELWVREKIFEHYSDWQQLGVPEKLINWGLGRNSLNLSVLFLLINKFGLSQRSIAQAFKLKRTKQYFLRLLATLVNPKFARKKICHAASSMMTDEDIVTSAELYRHPRPIEIRRNI